MALAEIVRHKRAELAREPGGVDLSGLERSRRSLALALGRPRLGYVLECKRASPSKGVIRRQWDPAAIAGVYARYADAVSVLVDGRFFGGSWADLEAVRKAVDLPVLCKDVVVDPRQVARARRHGADAVLLMLSVLDDEGYRGCAAVAEPLGLDVICEVRDQREVARAIDLGARIIGVNNRDLGTLEVDLSTTARLTPLVPPDRILIAESGVANHRDALHLRPHADALLVGSALCAREDTDRACRELVFGEVKICGIGDAAGGRSVQAAGASWGGLVFAPRSPRRVPLARALEIRAAAPSLSWAGVFVDEAPERVAEVAGALELDAVQLHGREGRRKIEALRGLLGERVSIWKAAFGGAAGTALDDGADRVLLDAAGPGEGGSGRRLVWDGLVLPDPQRTMLAGGIAPGCAALADRVGAVALDASSGVESSPGVKDPGLLGRLFEELRGTAREGRVR